MILAYLIGLATLPALYMFYVLASKLLDRNLVIKCSVCGLRFGVLSSEVDEGLDVRPTFTLITEFKFKWHQWTGKCVKRDLQEFKSTGE